MTKFAADLAAAKASGPTGAQRSSLVPELSGPSASLPGWSAFILPPDRELAQAWRGRQRTETVEAMLNDSQVASLRQVVRLPVHTYVIELDPRDCPPAAAAKLADDLDVPLKGGEERDDLADDFSARRHLDRAMDALDYGHAVFEHEGRVDEDGWWRLVDLPPVPQWTIDDENSWEIDRFGHVIQVVQWSANPPVKLPVDHLVTFTWQGRPGDPRGRSMLRPLYGSWLLRDRTMRVMGMSAERTGMGIPMGRVPVGAPPQAKADMERLLSGMAAGHDTNLVLETDQDIRQMVTLMGVSGSTPDLVAMLRYHDEAMARAMLAMLVQLGQTQTGSRALGSTFDDLLALFRDTIVRWYCDTMNKQLVARWVERNPVEGSPRLVWRRREDTPEEAADDSPPADPAAIDGTATEIPAPAQLPAPAAASRRRRPVRAATTAPDVTSTSSMVAFYPRPAVAASLAAPDGLPVDDLHVTLAYLGDVAEDDEQAIMRLKEIVQEWAASIGPLVDVSTLPEVRRRLIERLDRAGIECVRRDT